MYFFIIILFLFFFCSPCIEYMLCVVFFWKLILTAPRAYNTIDTAIMCIVYDRAPHYNIYYIHTQLSLPFRAMRFFFLTVFLFYFLLNTSREIPSRFVFIYINARLYVSTHELKGRMGILAGYYIRYLY